MRRIAAVFSGLVVLPVLLAACADAEVSTGDVYIAGYSTQSGSSKACYWKNGLRNDLPAPTGPHSYAYDIFVQGTDVYVFGMYADTYETNERACYWKNGTRTDLTNIASEARAGFVSGEDVYAAGQIKITNTVLACYWKNGGIQLYTNDAYIMDMHVVGADVYLAGDSAQGAWYCRNADMFLLDGAGSRSFGIFVTNSTVHASGVSSSNTACLWINGSLTNLLAGMTNMARVSGFTIRGTDQYAVGYHTTSSQDHLWLWKNGVRTDLYASLDLDEVMFAVVGGTVHIAVTDDAAAEPKVVYLKDGEARDIATQAGAKAICVVEQ